MRLLAPAKINLHLRVGPRRDDGFHSLLSWMCTVGLFDELEISADESAEPSVGASSATPAVALTCDAPGVPTDSTNLVAKAATRLAEGLREGGLPPLARLRPARVRLLKRVPTGGGLGGGSSNAARGLLGFNRLWGTGLGLEELATVAEKLGSDVPFFLFGPSSICEGRGEIVRPVTPPSVQWVVLILPDISMPTPAVYRKFDEMGLGREQDIATQEPWHEWAALRDAALLPLLVNDLEPAAFAIAPALGRLRADVEQSIGRIVRLSGSGSSLFTLFDDEAEARRIALLVSNRFRLRSQVVSLAPEWNDDLSG